MRLTTAAVSMNIILKGQLGYMNQFFEVVGVTTYDEKHYNDIVAREGIRMISIPMARTIAPLQDVKALWQLYRLFKTERPTIVHTHTPKAGLLGQMAAWLARVPIRMHTVGGMPLTEVNGLKRQLLNVLEKLTYWCANGVYPNSKGLRDIILAENFCHPDKLKVLANGGSNGINVDYFKPDYIQGAAENRLQMREALNISDSNFVFCFVGRIAREKGMVELLHAFQRLKKEFPIKLILVGLFEKHYGAVDAETQSALESDPDIFPLGRFDDVRPYYAMSDAYIFPSYREGFPNSVLEAGAMGLPSIVTNINGCNEIVQHGKNGLIIEPKNELELETTMRALLQDKPLVETLKQNARPVIVEQFRREFVWEELLREYKRLLKEKTGKAI